jgi:hypothetical protein
MDDNEIEFTVKSAFENATNPERIFVGVSLIAKDKKFLKLMRALAKQYPRFKFLYKKQKQNNYKTLGIGKNRYWATTLYDDQDYLVQVDSHSHFDVGWDTYMLDLFEEATAEVGDDKLVLTCIPGRFEYRDGKPHFVDRGEVEGNPRCPHYVKDDFFVNSVPKWADFFANTTHKRLFPAVKANGAMLFGGKEFARDTVVYFDAFFYDEEFGYTVNLYGRGFALVFPNVLDFPIYHLDGDQITPGHERAFFMDYVDASVRNDGEHQPASYYAFINDPKNQAAIKKYEKYARIDVLRGYQRSEEPYTPEKYRV